MTRNAVRILVCLLAMVQALAALAQGPLVTFAATATGRGTLRMGQNPEETLSQLSVLLKSDQSAQLRLTTKITRLVTGTWRAVRPGEYEITLSGPFEGENSSHGEATLKVEDARRRILSLEMMGQTPKSTFAVVFEASTPTGPDQTKPVPTPRRDPVQPQVQPQARPLDIATNQTGAGRLRIGTERRDLTEVLLVLASTGRFTITSADQSLQGTWRRDPKTPAMIRLGLTTVNGKGASGMGAVRLSAGERSFVSATIEGRVATNSVQFSFTVGAQPVASPGGIKPPVSIAPETVPSPAVEGMTRYEGKGTLSVSGNRQPVKYLSWKLQNGQILLRAEGGSETWLSGKATGAGANDVVMVLSSLTQGKKKLPLQASGKAYVPGGRLHSLVVSGVMPTKFRLVFTASKAVPVATSVRPVLQQEPDPELIEITLRPEAKSSVEKPAGWRSGKGRIVRGRVDLALSSATVELGPGTIQMSFGGAAEQSFSGKRRTLPNGRLAINGTGWRGTVELRGQSPRYIFIQNTPGSAPFQLSFRFANDAAPAPAPSVAPVPMEPKPRAPLSYRRTQSGSGELRFERFDPVVVSQVQVKLRPDYSFELRLRGSLSTTLRGTYSFAPSQIILTLTGGFGKAGAIGSGTLTRDGERVARIELKGTSGGQDFQFNFRSR